MQRPAWQNDCVLQAQEQILFLRCSRSSHIIQVLHHSLAQLCACLASRTSATSLFLELIESLAIPVIIFFPKFACLRNHSCLGSHGMTVRMHGR